MRVLQPWANGHDHGGSRLDSVICCGENKIGDGTVDRGFGSVDEVIETSHASGYQYNIGRKVNMLV